MYPIYVSGTCDNSLLTNYPFFQTQGSDFDIIAEEKGHPQLINIGNDYDSQSTMRNNNGTEINLSKANSMGSKSAKSNFGFTPIPQSELERACAHACNWLNEFILSTNIDNFPRDVIQSNGSQFYELLSFLTKRSFAPNFGATQNSRSNNQNNSPIPAGINSIPYHLMNIPHPSNMKRNEKVMLQYVQYANLIHNLKESGLMLNTIRPEYLLSHSDINVFYKVNPSPFSLPNTNKISEKKHRYISQDAWLTLFYQILKTFYLCRITWKTLKNMGFSNSENTNTAAIE